MATTTDQETCSTASASPSHIVQTNKIYILRATSSRGLPLGLLKQLLLIPAIQAITEYVVGPVPTMQNDLY